MIRVRVLFSPTHLYCIKKLFKYFLYFNIIIIFFNKINYKYNIIYFSDIYSLDIIK